MTPPGSRSGMRLPVIAASNDIDSPEARDHARALMERIDGEVRFGRHDRMLYATDASIYQVEPIGVVLPRTVDDIQSIVEFARERGIALLPRGGGTALAGQTVAHALVIDFSKHCRAITEIDPETRTCRVESGVVLEHLNQSARAHGLRFGPDVATASHATLGGMIGNNSAGAHSIVYGRTVEHLRGLDVVLADGREVSLRPGAAETDAEVRRLTASIAEIVIPIASEIESRFPRIRRHVDGYNLDIMLEQLTRSSPGTWDAVNLAHLICGSEGTLAIMKSAVVDLVPVPAATGLIIVPFSSLDDALAAVNPILESQPSAVELLDDVVIEMGTRNPVCARFVDELPDLRGRRPGAVLYVEYFADDEHQLERRLTQLTNGYEAARAYRGDAMRDAWQLRKSGEPLLHAVPGARKPITFIEDTAVDPSRLPGFVRDFRAIVERHGTRAAYYAHASVGCLHIRPLIDLRSSDDLDKMTAIAEEVTDLVVQYGGALSGEHGDGRVRSHLLERFYGPVICDAFRRIKGVFDPDNRLNPGNIVMPPPGAHRQALRVAPRREIVNVPKIETYFRYGHGFGEAVEQCNGAGVCRKTSGGTMCPSYRATLEERHATRGRGNALRLAITGQICGDGSPAWHDPETLATLDLCLSCKACKAECPSNVDIARLKAEYLAQSYRNGSTAPIASRLIADVRRLNRLGSRMHWVSNIAMRTPLIRALPRTLLGMDRRRSFPSFARSLVDWNRGRRRSHRAARPQVILITDCFTCFNEPHVGRAAIEVLESLGYGVIVHDLGCCGRAAISVGLLEEARTMGVGLVRALARVFDETEAIAAVALEPSCLSSLVDDLPDLAATDDESLLKSVAQRTYDIVSFIADGSRHPQDMQVSRPIDEPILMHGHCHQKALWGVRADVGLLRQISAHSQTELLDSGCCGMAGSFGFARSRYEISMLIGELALFPAIRAAPEATIVAPGTSCRHQISDGVGRKAHHPIELVHRAIAVE